MNARFPALMIFGIFLFSSCVTPRDVTILSPVEGTEIVPVNSTGVPLEPPVILVTTVTEGSPAWEAGFRSGMRVKSINDAVPLSVAHALSLCNDSAEISAVIDEGGTERTLSAVRNGVFGLAFAGERSPSATINASGDATSFAVTNPQYVAFTETMKPTLKKPSPFLFNLGLYGTAFGGAFSVLGIIYSNITFSEREYNTTTHTYETVETQPMAPAGEILLYLGVPTLIIGLASFIGNASRTTYPANYTIPQWDLKAKSLFPDGFNGTTGVNVYGITRDGTFPDGTKFEGDIVEGKMNGYGKMTSADGKTQLIGVFSEGYLNGLAISMDISDPSKPALLWFGTFRDSKADGLGIEFGTDGKAKALSAYEGGQKVSSKAYPAKALLEAEGLYFFGEGFTNGLASGKGYAIDMGGTMSLIGTFSRGYLVQGTKKTSDGTVLTGTFDRGELAEGSFRGASGVGGSGTWINGRLVSPGTLYRADGSIYTGNFDAIGLAQGRGTMKYPNGDTFTGTFKNDIPDGSGTYTFASGTSYAGEISGGTFEGKGVQVKPNGETYEGEFRDGLPHGMGIYKYDGNAERAEYYEGKRIDQLYLIRLENEKQRIEKARLAEEQAQREREAEERRLAEERQARELARKKEEQAQAAKRNKALFGAILGGASSLALVNSGATVDEAAYLGTSIYKDVMNDSLGSGESFTKQAQDDVSAGISSGDRWNMSKIGDTSLFSEKPISRSDSSKPLAGSAGSKGGSPEGTWKKADGSVSFGPGNKFVMRLTKSINGNPGAMIMEGTYTYDAASQRVQYSITKDSLEGSAGYDTSTTYDNPKTYSDTLVVSGNSLTFGTEHYTR